MTNTVVVKLKDNSSLAGFTESSGISLTAPCRGWVLDLSEAPDPAFAEELIGPGVVIEPFDRVICAPIAGTIVAIAETRHAITIEAENGAQILIHIGIDTVSLAGDPFRPLVEEGTAVVAGTPLIEVDHDKVLAAGKSLATPLVLVNADEFEISGLRDTDREVTSADCLFEFRAQPVSSGIVETSETMTGSIFSRTIVIPMPHGMHARPAARISALAKKYDCPIELVHNGRAANAKSPTALLRLGLRKDDELVITAAGSAAEEAVASIGDLIELGAGDSLGDEHRSRTTETLFDITASVGALHTDGQYRGVTASSGLVIGPAFRFVRSALNYDEFTNNPDDEVKRLRSALDQTTNDLPARNVHGDSAIVEAHQAILQDDELWAQAEQRVMQGKSAPAAWSHIMRGEAQELRRLDDIRLAERASDFEDLERQVILTLLGEEIHQSFPEGAIIIADDLYPSDMPNLIEAKVGGFATIKGGPTSHLAILAAARGLPGIVAVGESLNSVKAGENLVLDADNAELRILNSVAEGDDIRHVMMRKEERQSLALARAGEKAVLASGERVKVFANLAEVSDVGLALANGAEGCGLLRTEFLFLDRGTPPSLEEQTDIYRDILSQMGERDVVIRTMDIGADKPARFIDFGNEENPALGVRGVRVGMRIPQLLDTQIEAILRASDDRPCQIMVPMVASVSEFAFVQQTVRRIAEAIGFTQPIQMGVMVETPAAAVTSHILAAQADFLSVGTNDLSQYTLAMDRTNDGVATDLNALHPGVLSLIQQTVDGASVHGRWVGVCGGLASEVAAIPILVGLGVTELSASSASIPEIKALLRQLDLQACREIANSALLTASAEEVRQQSLLMLRKHTDID